MKTETKDLDGRWQVKTSEGKDVFVSTVCLQGGLEGSEIASMDSLLTAFGVEKMGAAYESLPHDETGWRDDLKETYDTKEEAEAGHLKVVESFFAARAKS